MISNGMYVLTSRSGEKYGGATITWLSQASFKPPLIVAAIRPESIVFECLSESRHVAVHVLAAHQQEIARRFLSTTEMQEGIMNGESIVEGRNTSPILKSVSCYIECDVRQIFNSGGDHALVVMEVVDAEYKDDFKLLLVADSPWKYGG